MAGAVDFLRGLTKGVAGAAGNEDAVRDLTLQQQQARQRQDQQNQLNLQTQLAPLHQQSVGLQKQIVDLTDPNTGQPYAGKEQQHSQLVDQLGNVIGKTRMLLHPPPPEDPHGLGYLVHQATDKLHITNDAAQKARDQQAQRVNNYQSQVHNAAINEANALAAANGGNPLNPEQQGLAAQIHANLTPKAVAPKTPTESADTRSRKDYEAYYADPAHANEPKLTFEEWKPKMATQGRAAVPKAPGKDDRYIAIQQKKASGQPLTPDEKAFETAYDTYVNKRYVEPGVRRAYAQGASRYIQVIDPSNPEQTTVMRASEAANAHIGTPASIGYQIDKAMTKYMTSGQGGANLTAFNTTGDHLDLLREAAKALQNGDNQLVNRYANRYAELTGSPAPTNFNTIKAAASGELAKTFKGTGSATDEEIKIINHNIDNAGSPEQLMQGIETNKKLITSKAEELRQQFIAGKQGRPDFRPPTGGNLNNFNPNPPTGPKTKQLQGMVGGGGTKGTVSLARARSLPQFQGMTDAQITAAATAKGYQVKP